LSRTYIYIDGFNLYYGAVRGTPYKWLDLMAMCKGILKPDHNVLRIKYFTALVHPTPYDPQKHIRQQTYLRALMAHVSNIEIVYGHFLKKAISHIHCLTSANHSCMTNLPRITEELRQSLTDCCNSAIFKLLNKVIE